MNTPSFILSPNFKLLTSTDSYSFATTDAIELKQIRNGTLFILVNVATDTYLLINPTIKQFLQAFQSPTTLPQVITQFAKTAQCLPSDIQAVMDDFFNDLYKQGILITTPITNHPLPFSSQHFTLSPNHFMPNGYQVTKQIHQNGNIFIYLAQDLSKQQQVVIKYQRMPPNLTKDQKEQMHRQFWQEFDILRELSTHTGICQILNRKEKDMSYAVLEYIDGWHLRKYIREQQPDIGRRLQLIAQIFEVVGFVHHHKITHGDIHISNFMVKKNHSIKLIDFGMANHEKPSANEYVREGGVYQYIPPERIRLSALDILEGRATYVSEVFQLGIVAYFILYETMPFKAFSWHSLAQQILTENPTYPIYTAENKLIPKAAIEIIAQSLAKQPKYRFQSAMDLSEAWQYLVMGKPSVIKY